MIKINDGIVLDYLNQQDLNRHKEDWFFCASSLCHEGKNIFLTPSDDALLREGVRELYDSLKESLTHFVPLNQAAWDELFPYWNEVEYTVDLIVGFPPPYDAVTDMAPDGVYHIIFDLVRWADYKLSGDGLLHMIRGLLTHEMTHILNYLRYPEIINNSADDGYILSMDKILFDEGFAHLFSYEGKELADIEWTKEKLVEVYCSSKAVLEKALRETDLVKQQEFLEAASSGSYYEKFACMCGMCYLAEKWRQGGIPALRAEMEAGYEAMSSRIIKETEEKGERYF